MRNFIIGLIVGGLLVFAGYTLTEKASNSVDIDQAVNSGGLQYDNATVHGAKSGGRGW